MFFIKYSMFCFNQIKSFIVIFLLFFSSKTLGQLDTEKSIDPVIKSFLVPGWGQSDLGFKNADRVENIRRVGEVAKLMVDAGILVLTAFISPFKAEREMVRNLFEDDDFVEIFVDTPLEIAESRDPKGLYKKARQGDLPNFTGIDSPYEKPTNPDVHIKTDREPLKKIIASLIKKLNL